ncbi:MAG: hypothetical protein GWO08_15140, partial [Gammaproteobacteria bacterium]|nr:hypothetical protein [Gammaproteobacteria bacterium]NIW49946.1 hypothetical protein [Gammaproteobacteria bacterium]NIX59395.1 hypothetical protein [candidate division Zixibacteria bacterium]
QQEQNQDQQSQGSMSQQETQTLDEQEAEQILNALRMNQDNVMKAQIQKKLQAVDNEKDW